MGWGGPAPTPSPGPCNAADIQAMKNAGSGNVDGTFPKTTSNCGSSSFNLFSGLDKAGFNNCLQGEVAISGGCSQCFADQAGYAVDNCKSACMFAWCGKSCLQCNDANKAALLA